MRQRGDNDIRIAVLYEYPLYVLQPRASRSRCSVPGTWYTVQASTEETTESEVRWSVLRVKTHCEQGLPSYTCYKQINAFLMRRGRKAKSSFPMAGGSIAKHNPARNPQCTQKSRKLLCPKPKVMPRFSLGDVGEARWLLSHRWTDTSPILPDAAHDSRHQDRVVSLSALSLLSACVQLRQLREVHHKLQQALNP